MGPKTSTLSPLLPASATSTSPQSSISQPFGLVWTLLTRMTQPRWHLCDVPLIDGPKEGYLPKSRFLDSGMFTKFNAWKFTEYDTIALMDSDILVLRDMSDLFTHYSAKMKAQNKSLAVVMSRRSNCGLLHYFCEPTRDHSMGMNAGVRVHCMPARVKSPCIVCPPKQRTSKALARDA